MKIISCSKNIIDTSVYIKASKRSVLMTWVYRLPDFKDRQNVW